MKKIRNKKGLVKITVLAIMVLMLGVLGEFLFNAKVLFLDGLQKGTYELDMKDMELDGFKLKGSRLVMNQDGGTIDIRLDGKYADKLYFEYDFDGVVDCAVTARYYNGYGGISEKSYKDLNGTVITKSVISIRETLDGVNLSFDGAVKGISISGIGVQNKVQINWLRMMFLWLAAGLPVFLVSCRKVISNNIEIGFLAIALTAGCLLVLLMPPNRIGWDEEIHFSNAYSLSFEDELVITPGISELMTGSMANWPYNSPRTMEERRQGEEYLNTHAVYKGDIPKEYLSSGKPAGILTPGYVTQSLMIGLGKLLGLPFSAVYAMGRLGNMLLYVTVVFFAIRRIRIGKRIMAVVALMPTPMSFAAVYTYDVTVTAFLFLGFSYMITELMEPEKPLTLKNLGIIVGSFVIGCSPKAVYIPLILLMLLLPADKFKDRKTMYRIKGGIILVFLAMMSTFVLPSIISPSDTGDARSGNTSNAGQMSMIFSHPFTYAMILLENIKNRFFEFTLGGSLFGSMGHFGQNSCVLISAALAVFVTMTDTREDGKGGLDRKIKIAILAVYGMVTVLIWTALYISFTPVGEPGIFGVQGRYFLPVLVPLYLVINSDQVKNGFNRVWYDAAVLGASCYILLKSMYEVILVPYCF